MKCPVCNTVNGSDVNFCEGCGRRIPRCPTCGMELTTRDKFCSNDGTRLSEDLLLLVPEESVLQAPVWSKAAEPTPAPAAPMEDDWTEGTLRAAPEPVVQSGPYVTAFGEDTVRSTHQTGGQQVVQSGPVVTGWDQGVQQPQRAFCENCGKRIAPGRRFCSDCEPKVSSGTTRKSGGKGKIILIIILILLLIAGLCFGGYAVINSDLFDWDSSSSNRAEKEKDDDEDEDEDEDEGDDEPTDPASVDVPSDVTGEDLPTAGVEDPVVSEDPTVPATEETTAPTEPETTPTTVPTNDPLMYWIENCDKMYLSASDLEGFDAKMCVYARNACYAKSGRKFNSTELQNYFAQFNWYNPTVSPDRFTNSMLNSYQVANINVVLEYERSHGYN